MKSLIRIVLLATAALLSPLLGANAHAEKTRVIAFTTDVASIAQSVGGDRIDVQALVPGNWDVDRYEPRPSDLHKLHQAQLFLLVGLGLEAHAGGEMIQQVANPKLQFADLSYQIPVLDVPAGPVDYSFGDIHPYGNPHYQLNPANGLIMARNVYAAFAQIDPDGRNYYAANLKAFEQQLNDAIAGWRKQMAPFAGEKFIPYHNSWSYFAQAFKLAIPAAIESKPGFVPSAARVEEVIEIAKAQKVKVIVAEPYYEVSIAKLVADQAALPLLVLNISVGARPEQKDYISMIDYLVQQFASTMGRHAN
ncbi:MAG: metal ABC transporter substrate-binding protein [Candidatus Binataceae bacterium]